MKYKVEYNKTGFVILGSFILLGVILYIVDLGSDAIKILGLLMAFMGFLSLLIISSTITSLNIAARILENQALEEEKKLKEDEKDNIGKNEKNHEQPQV